MCCKIGTLLQQVRQGRLEGRQEDVFVDRASICLGETKIQREVDDFGLDVVNEVLGFLLDRWVEVGIFWQVHEVIMFVVTARVAATAARLDFRTGGSFFFRSIRSVIEQLNGGRLVLNSMDSGLFNDFFESLIVTFLVGVSLCLAFKLDRGRGECQTGG